MVLFMLDQGLSPDVGQKLLKQMSDALEFSLTEHNAMIAMLKDSIPAGNLAFCKLDGYQRKAFDLTKKFERLSKHGGIIRNNDLCLRLEELVRFVRLQPGYRDWRSNKITRNLKDMGALAIQENTSNTVHLPKPKGKKCIPRVYRIKLDILEKYSKQY
jgi:hypothetical protein